MWERNSAAAATTGRLLLPAGYVNATTDSSAVPEMR